MFKNMGFPRWLAVPMLLLTHQLTIGNPVIGIFYKPPPGGFHGPTLGKYVEDFAAAFDAKVAEWIG